MKYETKMNQTKLHGNGDWKKPKKDVIRLNSLMPEGIPRYVRVYDNKGETLDRYTVVFTGHYTHKTGGSFWYLGMNAAPFHPQGIGQHGESRNQIDRPTYSHLGKKINFIDLPEDCKTLTIQIYKDLWFESL